MNYEVCRYKGEYAIFDKKTRCYILFSKSKKELNKRCRELNKMYKEW